MSQRFEDSSSSSNSSSSSISDDEKEISAGARSSDVVQAADPDSSKNSSDESGSSDGVLVEIPGNSDQEPRCLRTDAESGILVNIDGSMQEQAADHADETGKEETFVDAPDQLGTVRSVGLEESMAMIDIAESSTSGGTAFIRSCLDDSLAECRKYKEEREVFGREVSSLRHQLQDLVDRKSLLVGNNDVLLEHLRRLEERGGSEDNVLSSPTPLHLMIGDCSKLMSHLRGILDDQLNSVGSIKELHSVLYSKDQEIDDLNVKVSESSVSGDVVLSCLGSFQESWLEAVRESYGVISQRLVASLALVLGDEYDPLEDSSADGISLIEKNTSLLIENHMRILSEIQQLGLYLAEVRPDSLTQEKNGPAIVLSVVREELQETKKTEAHLLEKIKILEGENMKMAEQVDKMKESLVEANAETSKTKMELEQAENKFVAVKEKLSIAVTKGKSLVQHRDSLKQTLAEKTSELDNCMQKLQQKSDTLEKCFLELQQKSDAMEAIEANTEGLKQSLAEKNEELEKCLAELQAQSDASDISEASAKELNHSLDEKTSELEKCLLELQQRSNDLEIARTHSDKLNEAQNLIHSLQESLSEKDTVLREIEQVVLPHYSPRELPSVEVINRVRLLVDQKHISDTILQENSEIKSALSSVGLPEIISSADVLSKINWIGKSFKQAEDAIINLQDEIVSAQIGVSSHESELSKAHQEIDHLTSSLLKEKESKDSVQAQLEDLRFKYEDVTERFSRISTDRDELMKILVEVSGSSLDDHSSVDTGMSIERCIGRIRDKAIIYLKEKEQFDRVQSLLYIKVQDLMLCEKILEEVSIERSQMTSLSSECARMSDEIIALRNEKESLQKELELVEERSSLIREKLSMAVKKGKGLVQEREGFKLSLNEKNSEIERLKQELQLQDSAITEYREQIKSLSQYPEHVQNLESNIVSLKYQREEIERSFLDSNSTLRRLLDSIESIILPTDQNFEGPTEKLDWILENIHKLEVAKAHAEQELQKVKEESSLQASRLADAYTTIRSLEDELSKAEMQISAISEENEKMHLCRTSIEQEMEKVKEEGYLQASKLVDVYTTVRSLEDALSHANSHISLLNTEKNESESKSKMEMDALKSKLTESMEDILSDPLMIENFRNKFVVLKNMGFLVQNMHDQFLLRGVHLRPGLEYPEYAKPSPLPKFEDFIKDMMVYFETVAADIDDTLSFSKIAEGLLSQAKHNKTTFEDLSRYMDDHIALTMQALQTARDDFIHMLELGESLKLNLNKLEALNEAQEVKLVSLQKENMTLLSACVDAAQDLQIEFPDLLDSGVEEGADESAMAAKCLLLTGKSLRLHFQQLEEARTVLLTTTADLKHKLKQAELTAEASIQEGNQNQQRISKLEEDLGALRKICSEMKIKIEDFQAKEDTFRAKEDHTSTAIDRGISGNLLTQNQIESLIDKVNSLKIPFNDLETPSRDFSTPIDKLIYVIDKVTELHHRMESLYFEKEDLQSTLASHVHEVKNLKKASETVGIDYKDLESKKTELTEVAVGLERIIQRLGGNNAFQDQKLDTVNGLLPILERLTVASSMESEISNARIQELVARLQAKEKFSDELSEKVKLLEESFHAHLAKPDTLKEKTAFETSTSTIGSEISEIENVGPVGKNSLSTVPSAPHARTMRKGSNDHLVLSIDPESDRLIGTHETDDKGHVFKSLNTSGLIPKQGKLMADRVDGIWVSGGQVLMRRPGARLGLIAYWIFLHLWLLGTIL